MIQLPMAAFVVYGRFRQAQLGQDLKFGVAVATAVAPVAVNSLVWAAVRVAMLEKQPELLLAKPIDYVPAEVAAALKHVKVHRDFLAMS